MNNIFYQNNIKMYFPIEVSDIDSTYQLFLQEKSDIYFHKYRKIDFTINEFNAFNLLLKVNGLYDILQQCEFIGLPTHIDYKELIERTVIDCGFLEGINFLYYIYKNKYKNIKIDLPETHLHPSVQTKLIKLISANCKQLIIFSHSRYIFQYITGKRIW